jgi:hypothetical protein
MVAFFPLAEADCSNAEGLDVLRQDEADEVRVQVDVCEDGEADDAEYLPLGWRGILSF